MKNQFMRSLIWLIAVSITFLGCDKLEEADDVEFDIEVDVVFVIDENATGSNVTYVGDPVTLSISQDSRVQQYVDKITSVRVKKIEYQITGFASEPPGTAVTFSNGVMLYGAVGVTGAQADVLSTVATVNLMTAGAVTELPVNDQAFQDLGDILLNDLSATIFTAGTLSSTPVSFNVPTTFTITIVADAL